MQREGERAAPPCLVIWAGRDVFASFALFARTLLRSGDIRLPTTLIHERQWRLDLGQAQGRLADSSEEVHFYTLLVRRPQLDEEEVMRWIDGIPRSS